MAGLVVIDLERAADERGSFARSFDAAEWEARGMATCVAQCNLSWNAVRGTLRGMHFQAPPHEEAKLIRCSRGSIYDVAIDLRPSSRTFRAWHGEELSADNGRMLFVPEGFAHGFLTLSDDSEVVYQMSSSYEPSAARGVRWNDPAFGIKWPESPAMVSSRDQSFPDFRW